MIIFPKLLCAYLQIKYFRQLNFRIQPSSFNIITMKLKFTFFALLLSFAVFAQTSDKGFSFQGFAIDPDGKALGATPITVKFTISASVGAGGNYSETIAVTTDPYGVFHAIIGKGVKESGSADFKALDFTKKGVIYKLKAEVKKTNGGIYSTVNESDFNAVPYARSAENGVPVGTVVAFAGDKNNIPLGWLICDGASILQSDYPQLYSAIGSAWGTSGSSFNVPDLRGMFLRGVNDGLAGSLSDPDAAIRTASKSGGNAGDKVGTVQADAAAMPNTGYSNSSNGAHSHTYDDNTFGNGTNCWAAGACSGGAYAGSNVSSSKTSGAEGDHSHTIRGGDRETRPNNAGVYYIIKY